MTDPTIFKAKQIYDEAEQAWYDVYQAPGIEGQPIQAEIPRGDQQQNAVRRALLSKGASLPMAPSDGAAISAAIDETAPIAHRAASTGWRDESQVFVGHRHVAARSGTTIVTPPKDSVVAVADQVGIVGDLETWQATVRSAKHSTTATLAVCATFGAPLLRILNRQSFGIVLFGDSRCGKSSAQLLAASALGFGREEDLPSLKATPAGLLAAALAFNDHMLPINEIGTAPGSKKDKYGAVLEATYSLTGGQDVLRHPSWNGGTGPQGSFQLICLLSSEVSPDAWAARNGQTRDPGEMGRLIGVPVLADGWQTIFDRAPEGLGGKALAKWETEQFAAWRQKLLHNRGVAFRDYIDALVEEPEWTKRRAAELAEAFEAHPSFSSITSRVARDIIAKFGVVYAGGVLANELGILPIGARTVGEAVRYACTDAIAVLPDPAAELRADLKLVAAKLSGGGIVNLDNCTVKQQQMIRNADGYQEKAKSGCQFVVRAKVFSDWFANAARTRRVLEWLDDEGFLQHVRERTLGRSGEWAQKQVTWPDNTRQRSICIYLPSGLADLNMP